MSRKLIVPIVIGITLVMVGVATWRDASQKPAVVDATASRPIESTTRTNLLDTVARMEARLAAKPEDGDAVVRLAEALVRLQRVNSDPAAVLKAEQRIRAFLAVQPDHYEAQRVLGTVLLSQHRFRDAIREAQKARAVDPMDWWNYGVIGDAHLELGEYDEAFAAFDRMGSLRPSPPAYARVAYALELKGDTSGALESMKMAADGTSGHDPEGQAWHYAQLGNLLLQRGRIGDARREFERAAFTFPNHPYAMSGLARVKTAEGDYAGALAIYQKLFTEAETPELAAAIGDVQAKLGRADQAEAMYVAAERIERDGWASEEPQPQALARFLAERGRKVPEAIALAEQAAAKRRDVHTMDALAWAYFKGGRLDEALHASEAALRTGVRDSRILYHAAAIRDAKGDQDGAKAVLSRVEAPELELDVLSSAAARALMVKLEGAARPDAARTRG